MSQQEYLCNMNDEPDIRAVINEMKEFDKYASERFRFIKKEAEGLKDQKDSLWRKLEAVLVDKKLVPEKNNLEYRFNDKGQVFCREIESPSGIEALISQLFD